MQGANDCVLPDFPGQMQAVSVDDFKSNLTDVVTQIHEQWPEAHIALMSAPPNDPEMFQETMSQQWTKSGSVGAPPPLARTPEHTQEYIEGSRSVAEGFSQTGKVHFLDIHDAVTATSVEHGKPIRHYLA